MKKVLITVLIVGAAIQLIPVNRENPPVSAGADMLGINPANPEVTAILKSACYDCHSNETKYPWYSKIAPISWWLKDHINEGREELNFSEWSNYSAKKRNHKLKEAIEMVDEAEMPLKSYTWMHTDSKLSDAQRGKLIAYFKSFKTTAAPDSEESED